MTVIASSRSLRARFPIRQLDIVRSDADLQRTISTMILPTIVHNVITDKSIPTITNIKRESCREEQIGVIIVHISLTFEVQTIDVVILVIPL